MLQKMARRRQKPIVLCLDIVSMRQGCRLMSQVVMVNVPLRIALVIQRKLNGWQSTPQNMATLSVILKAKNPLLAINMSHGIFDM
ncbi:hypothetical protein D3C77_670860 [compost metagenome]